MSKINYVEIRDRIISYLESQNKPTATCFISKNLLQDISIIEANNPDYSMIPDTLDPYVCVYYVNKHNEQISQYGGNISNREYVIAFNIFLVTSAYSMDTGQEAESQLLYMLSNVEEALRAYITLGNYASTADGNKIMLSTVKTNQIGALQFDTMYKRTAIINFEIQGFLQ